MKIWDAIVVGSGPNGSMAAKKLTEQGLKVLMLEAGPPVEPHTAYGNFVKNGFKQLYRHFKSKRQEQQKSHPTYWATNPDLFVDDIDNPYTHPDDKPFRWIRGRQLGGRSLTWDAVTPRLSDYEFQAAKLDGFGPSWPIKHADLASYYDEIEQLLEVHGSKDGLKELPDGNYLEPKAMTAGERAFKERVEKKYSKAKVLISRGLSATRSPTSPLSVLWNVLKDAQKTGRLTIRTGAVVSKISGDQVEFIDSEKLSQEYAKAKVIFLCASSLESVRILLHSNLGTDSGVLGRYIMDHSAGNVYFYMPELGRNQKPAPLLGSDSILIPRYQNLETQDSKHLRGFGIWGGIGRLPVPRFLHKHRDAAIGFLCARSETLPHHDNRIELSRTLKDKWGIPAAHITCEWKPEDIAIAQAGREAALEIVQAAGCVPANVTDLFHTPFVSGHINKMQKEWKLSTPGMFVHEVGGARMGDDPKGSVVNPFGQLWDAKHVFVTDGACWPTSGWQNPTLTQMAITARGCDRAIEELKRLNL
ncbi:MAG: GMC family oxidoreductase [Deltaproteobacteria bacterium]|nr:GMC family oxidoreductase [Deltaproteobacteria bacterium]